MGAGVGGVPPFSSPDTCPFASNSVPVVTDCGEEDACTLPAFVRGSWARNRGGGGPVQRSAPGEGPVPGQLKA